MNEARATLFARLGPRHVVLIGVVAALLAFLPSVADGFVFDDEPLIVRNPFAHDLAYAGRCFVTDLWDTPERTVAESSTRFYRPAVCVSYILNWKLGGGAPWAFHLVNIALHAAACALAARVALRWTGSVLAALLATLVFAIHPTHTENVIWVSGRTDVLMVALLLGAHELAVSAARARGRVGHWLAAAALFVLSLLSKEVAICWPLLLAVETALAARDATTDDAGAMRRRLLGATLVTLATAVAYVAIRGATLPLRPREIESMTLPPLLHAGYVALSLGYYVERVFFPWPQTFHFRPLSVVNGEPLLYTPSVVLGAVAAVLWAFWLVRALRRERALAVMLGVATLVALPILNVSYTGFPGTTADRFLYLPLFLVALAAGRHTAPSLDRWAARPLSPLVTIAAALVACAVSWVRSLDYVSNETVWRHELEVNPDNPQALAGLSQLLGSRGDLDEASALLRRALSPEALRYKLLANPSRYYLGLLEMQGPRLADGNVAALEALLGEIGSLLGVSPSVDRRGPPRRSADLLLAPPLWDEHFTVHLANASEHLAASAAIIASRLGLDHGKDDLVHPLMTHVDRGLSLDAAAHYNLALALGRGGDYAAARRELARAVSLDGSETVRGASEGLDATLSHVEKQRTEATSLGEPDATLARATAYLELGAYLRAARKLRTAYLARPDDAAIAGAYLDALVHARLDAEADEVATKMPDPTSARARLTELRGDLSPRTAHALAPPPGTPWWTPDDR
ncbi:MAG TPA: hypothetical protein VH062_02770 [Polyangiaceae bacterium]|jgi:tetratricopeptide (TPR) repeat protein|nr:hypothetical protein [Polyangiaceae bacterium]